MPERLGPPLATPLFGRVALIGLGLIGSSIARAARHLNLARTIVAIDRDEAVAARVRELGIADEVVSDPAAGVKDADLVVLCVPVGAIGAAAAELAPHLKPGAIVSDVGSVKGAVVAAVQPHLPEGVALVPGHPIAGTEFSGPDAGFATLFQGRWCILTPPEGTDPAVADLAWRMRLLERDQVLARLASLGCPVVAWRGAGTVDDVMRRLARRAQLPQGRAR